MATARIQELTAESTAVKRLSPWGHRLSMLCAVHCIAMPLLVGIAPIFAAEFVSHEWVEWALIASCFLLVGYNVFLGYRIHAHGHLIGLFFISGAIVVAGQLLHGSGYELPFMIFGALGLATTGVMNSRHCHACHSVHHLHDGHRECTQHHSHG